MNYFEIFELPVSLVVDQSKLSSQYFVLEEKYSVDPSSNGDEEAHGETLERSAMVNGGFEVLKDPEKVIKYVLEIKGLLPANENYQLPEDFLMEMATISKGLTDGDILNIEEAETKVFQSEKSLYYEVQHIIDGYSDDTITEGQLLQVKDYYYRKKYLDGILERLDGMRNIAG
ncbi:MAG: hypothetical protein ABI416_17650 [Ginsengibacter sp.]